MKVKRLINGIVCVLVLLITSCTDETFDFNEVEEGLPASVTVKVDVKDNAVVSRAERDSVTESRVDNIYLFIFDNAGNLHHKEFFLDLNYDATTDEGKFELKTKSLNGAKFVAIANLTTNESASVYDITPTQLDAIESFAELNDFYVKMHSNSIERSGVFLMTGEKETNIPVGKFTCDLVLRRVDAKIKFEVDTDPKLGYSDFSFQPKTWVVKQVPSQSGLIEKTTGDYDGSDAGYFSTPVLPFEEIKRDETGSLYKGGSFVFYMPENRKERLIEITDYAKREEWTTKTEDGREFKNANPNSTYVEMTGVLYYKFTDEDSNEKEVNADVRFIVHLGYASGNPNDYDTKRNTFYTYKVKVRGVDDIVVEVDSGEGGEDKRPGYEGDVIYNETGSYVFDSHYDRRLITMNPANIADGSKVQWGVSTPFSRGIHQVVNGNEEIEENMRDYRWLKFAINKDYGVADNNYVKYPGDQNYNDPYPMVDAVPGKDFDASSPYYTGKPEARLLDIQQLCVRLNKEKEKGNLAPIAITVFVDEYLYFKHPITGDENNGRSLWKLTTDKEERTLHLIVEDARFSQDGNSSKVTAQYSFKQRSIQTVFDPDKEGLETAWGLESKMETGRLSPDGVANGTSTLNGRENTLKCILGVNYKTSPKTVYWTDLLGTDDPDNPYKLVGAQTAIRACMLRNRDLNGDNIVQANEIRWYLASIDQLTDIYLGEYALDEQSRLYPRNAADRVDENGVSQVRWHYTSSSAVSNKNEAWKLWAEEGASRGGIAFNTGDKLSYRCVRNLGISLDNSEETPTDLVSWEQKPDGYLIDVTNMNPKARRSYLETAMLPPHNERSDLNRPYAKFFLSNKVYGGDGFEPHLDGWRGSEWNDYPWIKFQTYTPYDTGFRIPNQRELLIMSSRLPDSAWKTFNDSNWSGGQSIKPNYICQTAFSLNGTPLYGNYREGFLWDSKNKVFFLQNYSEDDGRDEGYVRPIKDIE